MAGQGTAALELLEDVPSLDVLLAPVGGGGLLAGCSTVARTLFPGMQVFGVEPDTANDTYLSLAQGTRVTIPPPPTIADGLRAVTPGALTFPVLRANLSGMLLVSDDGRAAMRYLPSAPHLPSRRGGGAAGALGRCRSRAARGWA
jgi:threonine dehydratase